MTEEGGLAGQAWQAWSDGEVEETQGLARRMLESRTSSAEAHHLLFLTSFVTGAYERAIGHQAQLSPSYSRHGELDQPVVDAYLHLGRYAEAEAFARGRGMAPWLCDGLAGWKAHPLRAELDALSVLAFADHPLSAYFPGFDAEIEGRKVVAHVDTGGWCLYMSPARAQELGIEELTPAGEGQFHGRPEGVPMSLGVARTFRLGPAVLRNIPVVAIPTLVGQQDFIVFGTMVLEPFLSTLDYPNRRLVLSPREAPRLRKEHLALLPARRTEVPFHLWGDHYMFARGGVGQNRRLNFFIDSGLVSFHQDASGQSRQAAFSVTAEALAGWGCDQAEIDKEAFESRLALSLGPLEQTELIVQVRRAPLASFGGVRIDGLLSHAFLQRYAWTLDFADRKYIFSTPPV